MDRVQKKSTVGKVVSLLRYPVKSMLGEELNSSYVTDRGLFGDRVYALIDHQTGKVASAKNPRKWGRLFDFRAAFVDSLQQQQALEEMMGMRTTSAFRSLRLLYQMVVRFSPMMEMSTTLCLRFLVRRLAS